MRLHKHTAQPSPIILQGKNNVLKIKRFHNKFIVAVFSITAIIIIWSSEQWRQSDEIQKTTRYGILTWRWMIHYPAAHYRRLAAGVCAGRCVCAKGTADRGMFLSLSHVPTRQRCFCRCLGFGRRRRFLPTARQIALCKFLIYGARGFCADCGSPIAFDDRGMDDFGVTVASLDSPDDVPIQAIYGHLPKDAAKCLNLIYPYTPKKHRNLPHR